MLARILLGEEEWLVQEVQQVGDSCFGSCVKKSFINMRVTMGSGMTSFWDVSCAGRVLLESESIGVSDAGSFDSSWKLDEFARPTKVFEVASIGLRLMSESPSGSRSEEESDAADEVSVESVVVFKFPMNWCLVDFHNCFLCSRDSRSDLMACVDAPFLVHFVEPHFGPSVDISN